MANPFNETDKQSAFIDDNLIAGALNGNKTNLEQLIKRHQAWIYNLCLRMLADADDAADLTQEILIKVITALGSFEGKSTFRTWLYRIVKNDVINWEKKKTRFRITSFSQFGDALDKAPESEIEASESFAADKDLIVKETKLRCMSGMLLCLDSKQRLVFILGELFEVTDVIGGEILETTKVNFRVMLSRAREQLYNFMNEKCGLENKNNPCRCARKTKAFIEAGIVDPFNLRFSKGHQFTIENMAERKQQELENIIFGNYHLLYKQHPFISPPDIVGYLRNLLSSEHVVDTFNFKTDN